MRVLQVNTDIVTGQTTEDWIEIPGILTEEEAAAATLLTLAAEVRAERDTRLTACDWTMLPDAPVDTVAWTAYRQALRDVTDQPGFPTDVTWPTIP